MKNYLLLLAIIFFLSSCISGPGNGIDGNGNVKSEHRQVDNFTGVKSSGSIDVELSTGEEYEVVIENDENLMKYVKTTVENGVLNISYKDHISVRQDHAKVYVTAPSLNKIIASGSANINFDDGILTDKKIEISVTGSGDIEGGIDAPEVSSVVSGSGNINLHGRTRDFEARSSGSGDINCSELKSENARVKINGSGNARVFASVSLDASVNGSGDIYYRGNPSSPKIHTAGSGSVSAE